MRCQRYRGHEGRCPRKATWLVNDVGLCRNHYERAPLEIVLADLPKFGKWIAVERLTDEPACQHRKPDECRSPHAVLSVNGRPYCQYHAEGAVCGEAMFDNYLKRLITIEPYREVDPDEAE